MTMLSCTIGIALVIFVLLGRKMVSNIRLCRGLRFIFAHEERSWPRMG
jgi:hypothetical protein